jgi:hypothetical protein
MNVFRLSRDIELACSTADCGRISEFGIATEKLGNPDPCPYCPDCAHRLMKMWIDLNGTNT